MQRIFANEQLSEANEQRLNQDLNEIFKSPNLLKAELLAPAANESCKKEISASKKSLS